MVCARKEAGLQVRVSVICRHAEAMAVSPAPHWMRHCLRASPRWVTSPRRSIAAAATPSLGWPGPAMPRAVRERWSTRSRQCSEASAWLQSSAHRSRWASSMDWSFQARSFFGSHPSAVVRRKEAIM